MIQKHEHVQMIHKHEHNQMMHKHGKLCSLDKSCQKYLVLK